MDTKHTRGPWFADTHGSGAFAIKGPDGAVLCTRNAWPGYATESIANGLLIAAAPDLLEALTEARKGCKLLDDLTGCMGDDDYVRELLAKIDAAIAKANPPALAPVELHSNEAVA
jgi:hypothetical protein